MKIVYLDAAVLVCIKPPRVLSTDEPGGMPELARTALGETNAELRTVHRLDRVVGGLMLLARGSQAAPELSRQIRCGEFEKEYLAVIHGCPEQPAGTFCDLLLRDKRECKTYVVQEPGKGVQEARLEYTVCAVREGCALVWIHLLTGRTHQIRAQFSARGLPLVGDRKYGIGDDAGEIALWSYGLAFTHPDTGEHMAYRHRPPAEYPWTLFEDQLLEMEEQNGTL